MLTLGTYKWIINNLANTMIVKITSKFSIANLGQTIIISKNLTYSCKIKIKIHIPATTNFKTKIKVNNQKLLALLLLPWKKVFAGRLFVAILNPINKTDSI